MLGHDLLARARRAAARGACRRETPVTLTLEDGTLVEGVVDLAFEEDGAWIVVDYKTDRELAVGGWPVSPPARGVCLGHSASDRRAGIRNFGARLNSLKNPTVWR